MAHGIKHAERQNGGQQRGIEFCGETEIFDNAEKQQHAKHRRKPDKPELRGLLHHATAPHAVLFLGHQNEHQIHCRNHRHRPDAAHQVDVRILQRMHGGRAHDEDGHIIPAGIIAGVQRIKAGIQHRHQRHYKACPQNGRVGAALAHAHVGKHARRTHHGQVGRHAGVLDDAVGKDIGQIGWVWRQEQRSENGEILLRFAVNQKTEAAGRVHRARVAQKEAHCRHQQHTPHGAAQHRLEGKAEKQPRAQAVFAPHRLPYKIDDEEHRLPGKKEIVVHKVYRQKHRQKSLAVFQHGLVQRPQQQWEQGDAVQKMVKKCVVHRKAGKRIQHAGNHRRLPRFGIPVQIGVCRKAAHAKLQHQQRHHGIGHGALRQQGAQPEKGRAQQVERIPVDGGSAKVCVPAPLAAGRFHKAVHIGIEGDLLAVEIAAVLEQALINNKERRIQNGRGDNAHEECEQIPFPEFFSGQATHCLLLLLY